MKLILDEHSINKIDSKLEKIENKKIEIEINNYNYELILQNLKRKYRRKLENIILLKKDYY